MPQGILWALLQLIICETRMIFEEFNLHSEQIRKSLLRDCVKKWNSLNKIRKKKGRFM